MEYFRHNIVVRIIAVLLAVILQFDMLDYIKEQISISIQSPTEWMVQEMDGLQDVNNDSSISLQRTRGTKQIRTRILVDFQNMLNECTTKIEQDHSLNITNFWVQKNHCPLHTLFCVLRI